MSQKFYTVLEADYLDEQEGIVTGGTVMATEGESPAFLYVTALGEKILREPIAVSRAQLAEIA